MTAPRPPLPAVLRPVVDRPHVLGGPILVTLLVGGLLVAFGAAGAAGTADAEAGAPGTDTPPAAWAEPLAGQGTVAGPALDAIAPAAPDTTPEPPPAAPDAAPPEPGPEAEEPETDEPAGQAADTAPSDDGGPAVNQPPSRPNRSVPEHDERPRPAPSSPARTAVHDADFPDPFVLRSGGTYWAFATQSGLTQVPTMRSTDLLNWERVGDALHALPDWAEFGYLWAPSVLQRGSLHVMYYTTRHRDTGLQCISTAISLLPQGPYVDSSSGPFVCQTGRGGSIDPSPFVDAEGRPWLLWKSEGTLLGEPTRIWVQALRADGRALLGDKVQLLERRLDWEFPIIEAPSMTVVDGRYHLFYSGNRWETAEYAVGHAVCESPVGPCRRTAAWPVLTTRPGEAGPGGQELVVAPTGELVMVHHAWEPGRVGYPHGARRLHVTALRFEGDRVRVGGPWGRSLLTP